MTPVSPKRNNCWLWAFNQFQFSSALWMFALRGGHTIVTFCHTIVTLMAHRYNAPAAPAPPKALVRSRGLGRRAAPPRSVRACRGKSTARAAPSLHGLCAAIDRTSSEVLSSEVWSSKVQGNRQMPRCEQVEAAARRDRSTALARTAFAL